MNEVSAALAPVAAQVEEQLKPYLAGLLGGFIRPYLPQVWTFTTERGASTLRVEVDGSARVQDGLAQAADVRIQWGHSQLVAALQSGGKAGAPGGSPPKIEVISSKGQTAFNFLRNRFGL